MKRIVVSIASLSVLAACIAPGSNLPDSALVRPGCYTVDLYDDPFRRNVVQPAKIGLPDSWNRYLGVWGEGAWNGGQCHEIHVTEVNQDGSVIVIDTVAPYESLRAESHRRTGRIDRNGRLIVPGTNGPTVYTFESGHLRGTRFRHVGGTDHVILNPKTDV
ncbi:hypothetical protein SAMN06273572_101198 [Monaibacterium marinum]|uniref:Uncharacterized protein n=1 Tax=Pontivivens marinum TaxID=1690039 RepID=A0A2C9CM22_9RHOB|nr:hypothetical protein [Monaibacterium marinum]SOH92354.1 hypothetical protein SAMN06273572_101198 [Monaibacterium marinum]